MQQSLIAQATIDLSKPVGSPKGSIGVSPSGGSTYSIPIQVLSGTNGMEPDISLNYNSQGRDINFGQGWSLSCLSSISRAGKTTYYNGNDVPVSYTNINDAFVLDGQRLFVTTGSYGANGAVYGAENENFNKIESFGGTDATGPDWFKVTTKSGMIMEYGNATDASMKANNSSNSKMIWLLNRVTDINGNYEAFHYTINYTDRNYVLSEIDYTGNTSYGIAPYNQVIFSYSVKANWQTQTAYQSGVSLATPFLLSTIDINNSTGTRVKRYQCSYTTQHSQYLLSSFKETGADGTTSLNPLTFTYGSNMTAADVTISGESPEFTINNTFVGDLTGDGKQDLVVGHYKYDNNGWPYYTDYYVYNNFSGLATPGVRNMSLDLADYVNIKPSSGETQIKTASNYLNFLTFDYDGDSKQDVLRLNWTPSGTDLLFSNIIINYSRIYSQAEGLDYVSQTYSSIPFVSGYGLFKNAYHNGGNFGTNFIPGDFDGDGAQDYILILGTNSSTNFKAFFSSPLKGIFNKEIIGFGVGTSPLPAFYAVSVASATDVLPIDFDGDGKNEILVQKDDKSYVLSLSVSNTNCSAASVYETTDIKTGYPVYPGDFNGDGNTDLLIRQSKGDAGGLWKILYSNGKLFNSYNFIFQTKPYLDHDQYTYAHVLMVADLNGDGKSDIWHSYNISTTSQHTLYYSNGIPTPGGNSTTAFVAETYTGNPTNTSINKVKTANTPIGDFDGDGKADVFSYFGGSGVGRFIYAKPQKEDRLMASVTDGLGGVSSFSYTLANSNSYIYKRSNSYSYDVRGTAIGQGQNGNPYMVINSPMYVVSNSYEPINNSGSWTSKTYQYQDAAVSTIRGFLGFKQVSVTDAATAAVQTNYSEIDASLLIPHTVRQTVNDAGTTVSDTKITDVLTRVSSGIAADKRYTYQITKTLTTNGITGATIESNNTYDNYNNVTDNVVNKGYLSGTTLTTLETLRTATYYGTAHGTPVPASPESVSTFSTRTGQSTVSKQTNYTYDTKGNVLTIKDWDGTPVLTTTTNVYDGFGNVTNKTVMATGVMTPVLTYTYDASGRFLTKKEAAGSSITKTETFSYDPTWGLLASTTTSDGLTTSYTYDGNFGKLTKTTLPDGNAISQSLAWESSANARYSVTKQRVADGGKTSKQYYNILGRVVKTETGGFNNQTLTAITTYNTQELVATQTDPYYNGETIITTTTTYDGYGRVDKVTNGTSSLTSSYTQLSNGQYEVAATNAAGQVSGKTMDAAGKVVSSTDNGGQLSFIYDSWGNQLSVQLGNTTVMSSLYDNYGRQTSLTDKNAGTISYEYDVLGRVTKQTDALNQIHTMAYDAFGRITTQTGPEGMTSYTYWKDPNSSNCNDNIAKVTGFSGDITISTYDNLARLIGESVVFGGNTFTKTLAYDSYGNLITTTYPSGVIINDTYDKNGALTQTTMGSGTLTTLFTGTAMNSKGIYTGYSYGNGKSSTVTYDFVKGAPSRYYTSGIQDLNLNFDGQTGNLMSRNDGINNLTETFTFDNLNRLASAKVGTTTQFSITYDASGSTSLGNIATKSDVGNYTYDNNKINAVKFITSAVGGTTPPGVISQKTQDITYTSFLKVGTITENNYSLSYTYGQNQQRIKSERKLYTTTTETKFYLGCFERQITIGLPIDIHYINAGNGLCAIITKQGNTVKTFFVYSDHLGSILTVTDAVGTVVAQQNFDAWGRNRNPTNWTYANIPSVPNWLYRGFTGHEHLAQFALINMNGRMYDPANGRMLSPDNYVPDPWSTQGYNRYGYCGNNPLSYTDADGNFFFLAPILIGALLGAYSGGFIAAAHGGNFVNGFWKGAIVGAVGGAIGGNVLAGSFSSWGLVGSGIANGAITGTVTGGLNSVLNGTNVLKGALGGAIIGGVLGGIQGALERLSIPNKQDISTDQSGTEVTGDYYKTQQELDNYINQDIGNKGRIETSLNTNTNLASETLKPDGYTMNNHFLYNESGARVGGTTVLKGGWMSSFKSQIYISPGDKGFYIDGINASHMFITHEYIHAYHFSKGLYNPIYSERAASTYSLYYVTQNGMTSAASLYQSLSGYYPKFFPNYSWNGLSWLLRLGIR